MLGTVALALPAGPSTQDSVEQANPPEAQDSAQEADPGAGARDGAIPESIRSLLLGGLGDARVQEPLEVEGSTLPERPGLVRQTPFGEWVFVYLDERGEVRASVLLPCRLLERIIDAIDDDRTELGVRLTGRFTVYRRANYLLPTAFGLLAPVEPAQGDQPADQSPTEPGPADSSATPEITPELQRMADELEAGRREARALAAPPVAAQRERSVGQPSATSDVLREGQRLVRRRARMVRDRGLWTLRFDQPANVDAAEPPLVLLPGSAMQAMEDIVGRFGGQTAFEVSGSVHRFGSRSYALITMYFAQPAGDLTPRG